MQNLSRDFTELDYAQDVIVNHPQRPGARSGARNTASGMPQATQNSMIPQPRRTTPHATAKAIPRSRDLLQSRILAACCTVTLTATLLWRTWLLLHSPALQSRWLSGVAVSLVFSLVAWKLRAATLAAAALGAQVSLSLFLGILGPAAFCPARPNAFPALLVLVATTHLATRFGRRRKEAGGLSEARTGRRLSQIAANLGVAALCASAGSATHSTAGFAACFAASLAALAEATADTVSSEVGQALSHPTYLLTSAAPVPPGTDGGISLSGTVAGLAAASVVLLPLLAPTRLSGPLPLPIALVVLSAAASGLLFDSLLGATLERRGWLGNDLVNFASTAFAAALAGSMLYLLPSLAPALCR